MSEGPVRELEGGMGILGGSFDPIHIGHTSIALAVRDELNLGRIYFIPARRNPLKKENSIYASAYDRLAMVRLATADYDWMIVDPVEVDRGSESNLPSYTIDTLKFFRDKNRGVPIVLIIGSDNANLGRWYKIGEFPKYIDRIAVISRPDFATDDPGFDDSFSDLKSEFPDVYSIVRFYPIADYDISATEIRELLSKGIMPDGMLNDRVISYIKQHGLYGFPGEK